MKLLLWNVGRHLRGGPTEEAVAYLEAAAWDVAVLLEVNGQGWERLGEGPWSGCWTGRPTSQQLKVAVLVRAPVTIVGEPTGPSFTTREGLYTDRVKAVTVTADGVEWTVVGAHMPNSVDNSALGGKDHRWKEHCFKSLREWISDLPDSVVPVVAMDANRPDWAKSTRPIVDRSREAMTFLREPERLGLVDAFLAANPDLAEKPATHWTGPNPQFFDRLFVDERVRVEACEVMLGRQSLGDLADHSPVRATITLPVDGPRRGVES